MARSPPVSRPAKPVTAKSKTKRTNAVVAIGNKMLQKRRINLVERNNIQLRQKTSVPITRDPKLDAAAMILQSRTWAKKSKVRVRGTRRQDLRVLGANRIYKKANRISAGFKAQKNQKPPQKPIIEKPAVSQRKPSTRLSIPISTILKKLVVPIKIEVEHNAKLETMIRNGQSKIDLNETDAPGIYFSASSSMSMSGSKTDESEAESGHDLVSSLKPDVLKAAGEYVRKALNAIKGKGTGSSKPPKG